MIIFKMEAKVSSIRRNHASERLVEISFLNENIWQPRFEIVNNNLQLDEEIIVTIQTKKTGV